MRFGQWYLRRGRIDRRTYWLHYFLPLYVLSAVVEVIAVSVSASSLRTVSTSSGPPSFPVVLIWLPLVVFLLVAVPSFSSQVARLHDRGHSAWWLLWALLPLAGAIVLLVQMCLPGDGGSNRYGPPPSSGKPVPEPPYPPIPH